MARRVGYLAGMAVSVVLASAAGAQPLTHRDIGVHMALDMVHAAIAACEAKGLSVSVVVLDTAGRVRAMAMADRGGGHTVEIARRKAYTALTFEAPSRDWIARSGADSALAGEQTLAEVITLRGGIPVKIGDETIGAVGVSGSTLDTDEGCAKTAAASVADRLK